MTAGHAPATVVAATLGTGRRSAPWPAVLPAAAPTADDTTTLLDALAVGAALRRAGRVPMRATGPTALAPEETAPVAPPRAAALLDLHLTQSPVGRDRADEAVAFWLCSCAAAGVLLPPAALPAVLDRASTAEALRDDVRAVAGARGRWLATVNPAWAWLLPEPEPGDPALLSGAARRRLIARIRHTDPAAGRALIESTWATDRVDDRRDHLALLRDGLSDGDEPLLEAALDDRSQEVRHRALDLLDGLPSSRRAARMADRLRPLLTRSGLLKRTLAVALPDDPDDAGVRDGLTAPPSRRSARGWWLERLAAGAPLDTWTEAGIGIPGIVKQLPTEARAGIEIAVQRRRDAAWAGPLVEAGGDLRLVALLPAAEAEARLHARLADTPFDASALRLLPRPWSPRFSDQVGDRLVRDPEFGRRVAGHLDGLHPATLARLAGWAAAEDTHRGARAIRSLIQLDAARTTIDEAFR